MALSRLPEHSLSSALPRRMPIRRAAIASPTSRIVARRPKRAPNALIFGRVAGQSFASENHSVQVGAFQRKSLGIVTQANAMDVVPIINTVDDSDQAANSHSRMVGDVHSIAAHVISSIANFVQTAYAAQTDICACQVNFRNGSGV